MEDYEGQFSLNDSIHDNIVFIFVFEADGTVVDNWKDFHRKSIKKSAFFYFNHLRGKVIHERTFGKFLEF